MLARLLSRAAEWLTGIAHRARSARPRPLPEQSVARPPRTSFADIAVVSTGWVTRREHCCLDELDRSQLAEMLRLLAGGDSRLRASLAGLWQIELRWQGHGSAATFMLLAGGRPARLGLLLSGLEPEDDEAASTAFCRMVDAELDRRFSLPPGLAERPLALTLRLPNTTADAGEHDLEAMRCSLAAAHFLQRGALVAPVD